jgi:hypothetical protein
VVGSTRNRICGSCNKEARNRHQNDASHHGEYEIDDHGFPPAFEDNEPNASANSTKPILESGRAARQRLLTTQRFLPFWTRCEAAKFKAPCLVLECTESEGPVALGGNIGGRLLFFDLRRNPVGILALSLTTTALRASLRFGSWMGSLNHDSLIRQTT